MHMSLACPRLARGLLAACMIWQVVLSTGTCESINLDLARAAPYRYFTQYGPAHADQNLIQQTFFIASFLSVSLVVLLYGVGRSGWTKFIKTTDSNIVIRYLVDLKSGTPVLDP